MPVAPTAKKPTPTVWDRLKANRPEVFKHMRTAIETPVTNMQKRNESAMRVISELNDEDFGAVFKQSLQTVAQEDAKHRENVKKTMDETAKTVHDFTTNFRDMIEDSIKKRAAAKTASKSASGPTYP